MTGTEGRAPYRNKENLLMLFTIAEENG